MHDKAFSDGLVSLVKHANRFIYAESSPQKICIPFYIDKKQVGFIRPDIVKELKHFPDVFSFQKNSNTDIERIDLSPDLDTFDKRTSSVAKVLRTLREKDVCVSLRGWRDEDYSIWDLFSEPPLMKMERSATALFGTKQYGVLINGYTHDKERGLCVWTGKRSKNKQTFPGKLDNMVGGGLASGQSIMECAIKESQEEASVPEHLTKNIKSAGTISYFYEDERGVFPEVMFVMDIELPNDFKPVNSDGEVESFHLYSISELKTQMITDKFKFNCAAANLDFLIRHGHIKPDEEPNYTFLVENIHRSLF